MLKDPSFYDGETASYSHTDTFPTTKTTTSYKSHNATNTTADATSAADYYSTVDVYTSEDPRDDEDGVEYDEEKEYFYEKDLDEESAVEESRSPRYQVWFLLMMFSLIATGSSLEARDAPIKYSERAQINQKWALSCATMTLIITVIVMTMHSFSLSAMFIVGTRMEAILILILSSFWAATVSVVCNTKNGLAVNSDGFVSYGNLYYSSWGGFICCLYLIFSYVRSVYYYDAVEEFRSRTARLVLWFLLMIFCLVTMGHSAYTFDDMCGDEYNKSSKYCRRTKVAVVIGALGVVVSLCVMVMRISLSTPELGLATTVIHFQFEVIASLLLFASFGIGLGFITSAEGPGSSLGNLYYSMWACFITLIMISVSCYEEYRIAKLKTIQELEDQNVDIEDEMMYQEQEFDPNQGYDEASGRDFMSRYDDDPTNSQSQMFTDTQNDNMYSKRSAGTFDQGDSFYDNQSLSHRSHAMA